MPYIKSYSDIIYFKEIFISQLLKTFLAHRNHLYILRFGLRLLTSLDSRLSLFFDFLCRRFYHLPVHPLSFVVFIIH